MFQVFGFLYSALHVDSQLILACKNTRKFLPKKSQNFKTKNKNIFVGFFQVCFRTKESIYTV